jgi:hypothetical protein
MLLFSALYIILGLIIDRLLKILSSNTCHCNELVMNIYREAFGVKFYPGSQEKTAPFITRLMIRFSAYKWNQIEIKK